MLHLQTTKKNISLQCCTWNAKFTFCCCCCYYRFFSSFFCSCTSCVFDTPGGDDEARPLLLLVGFLFGWLKFICCNILFSVELQRCVLCVVCVAYSSVNRHKNNNSYKKKIIQTYTFSLINFKVILEYVILSMFYLQYLENKCEICVLFQKEDTNFHINMYKSCLYINTYFKRHLQIVIL